MLSIYSEVFDRFFTYDIKYQKNVLNLLQNILLRHNVIVEPVLESGFKTIGKQTTSGAKLSIRSIKSDTFQYKVKGGSLITDAKDERYLKTIRKILYYVENEEDNLKKSVVVTNADKYEKIKSLTIKISKKKRKIRTIKGRKTKKQKAMLEKIIMSVYHITLLQTLILNYQIKICLELSSKISIDGQKLTYDKLRFIRL